MKPKTITCPNCSQPAEGNFCSHCGAPVISKCPSCGTEAKPGSRACSQCGASFTGQATPKQMNVQTIAPWVAMGLATVALVISVLSWFDRGSGAVPPAPVRFSQSLPTPLSVPGQPPDLASMSPREAADRLFNRVMSASENGNTEEAQQFAPMALQAYNNLGTLDNDARYHMALIHLTSGDTKQARTQIDSIRKSIPGHLLATTLEYEIAERGGNNEAVVRAAKRFLASYDAEIAMGRGEYRDHLNTIERFHKAAQTRVAGKK